jgi:hypothetical protein
MFFSEFQQSLSLAEPPNAFSPHLKSLWYDRNDDWEKAHAMVQDLADKTAAWIHAYLHRKEGDIGNADYWYNRADRNRPALSLGEEWESLVKELLAETR